MAVVMCQTRKVLHTVAPGAAVAARSGGGLTFRSRRIRRPDAPLAIRRPQPLSCPAHRSGARGPAH